MTTKTAEGGNVSRSKLRMATAAKKLDHIRTGKDVWDAISSDRQYPAGGKWPTYCAHLADRLECVAAAVALRAFLTVRKTPSSNSEFFNDPRAVHLPSVGPYRDASGRPTLMVEVYRRLLARLRVVPKKLTILECRLEIHDHARHFAAGMTTFDREQIAWQAKAVVDGIDWLYTPKWTGRS